MHDAEAAGFRPRHLEAADRDVGAAFDMLLQHDLVIHLVDVVAGEHQDVLGAVRFEDVDVLIDRIRRADIPHRFGDALARGQDIETLVSFRAEEVPAALQMPD